MQTLTTVGYGDFGAKTTAELLLSLFWMLFGVSFYSFVIGNLTSIIASDAINSQSLHDKVKALEEFAHKTKLNNNLVFKIKQFLEINYKELFSQHDEENLLNELPTTLKEEVNYHRFHAVLETFEFFNKC